MDDRRVPVLVVSIIFFVFASVFVGFYLISCVFVVKKLKLPDHLMLLAWALDFGFVFSLLYAVGKGFGLHGHNITPENQIIINKSTYVFNILYDLTKMVAKSSISIFFLALTHEKKAFYRVNYALIFVIIATGLALTMHQVFECHPLSNFANFDSQPSDHCTNVFVTALSSSPYNISTDIALLFIPIPLLTRVSLPFKQRVILVITFGASITVIAADIARLAFLQNTAEYRLKELHSFYTKDIENHDYTWYAAFPFMLSVIEVNMTIVCACVPSLKPLAERIFSSLIFNPHEASRFKSGGSKGEKTQPAASESDRNDESPGEMMAVLTSESGQHDADGKGRKGRRGNRDRYPHNIKLLHLLNLRPTRILRLNGKQSIPPNTLVTVLFFLWGLSYGTLEIIAQRISIVHYGQWATWGLGAGYWAGYLAPLLFGRYILRKLGFTPSFIWGLYIFALGNILIWPSLILLSVPISSIGILTTGAGLGILEMTANLFIAICGPLEYTEVQLCIAQAFQGLGSLLSRLLAGKGLVRHTDQLAEVISLQWAYLAIAFFNVLLAVIFYYLPVPQAPDEDLKKLAQQRPANSARVFGVPVVYLTLALGSWSQFFFMAGQEGQASGWTEFQEIVIPRSKLDSIDYISIGSTIWIIARLAAAFLLWKGFKARWLLLILYISTIIVSIICTKTTGLTSITFALLIWFTNGPIYPINFAISIRGMGVHAKTAAACLVAAASGAGVGVIVRYAAWVASGHPGPGSYYPMVGFFSAGAVMPVYLNVVPAAKRQVDPIKDEYRQESEEH